MAELDMTVVDNLPISTDMEELSLTGFLALKA